MAGYSGLGTVMSYFVDPDWLTFANLTSIGGPGLSLETIDVSSHDSWKQTAAVGTCVFDNTDETITAVDHGLLDGQTIRFSTTTTLPAELNANRWYWVRDKADDTFKVAATEGGAAIDFTDDGAGTHSFHYADPYREFTGSVLDGGEVSFEGNLTTAAAGNAIKALADARAEVDFKVTFPTTDLWELSGVVTAFGTSAPYDDKLSFSASVKVSGKPVLTVA